MKIRIALIAVACSFVFAIVAMAKIKPKWPTIKRAHWPTGSVPERWASVATSGGGGPPAPTFFHFEPQNAATNPSINRLDASLCVGATCSNPKVRYKMGDCDATDCDAWTYGEELPLAGSGSNPTTGQATPLFEANDLAVKFEGGKYYQAAAASTADPNGTDWIFEVFFRHEFGDNDTHIAKRSTQGFEFTAQTDGKIYFNYQGASGGEKQAVSGSFAERAWMYFAVCGDVGGNMQAYINGTATGTATDISGTGSASNAGKLTIGAASDGTAISDEYVSYFAFYQRTSWFADVADCGASIKTRAAKIMGAYPAEAIGTPTPVNMTRASSSHQREAVGGVTTLWRMGRHWMVVDKVAEATGYSPFPQTTNLMLQSEDVSTSWTELNGADTQSLNSVTAPNGTATADGNIADATDTEHGFSQAVTSDNAWHSLSLFAKAGDKDWVYIANSSKANHHAYFNVNTCAAGTKGSGASGVVVRDYGNGWCRVIVIFDPNTGAQTYKIQTAEADNDKVFAGDGATVNTTFWGVTLNKQFTFSPYVATTTTSVTREQDSLSFNSDNYDRTIGSYQCSAFHESMDQKFDRNFLEANDGTNGNRILLYAEKTSDAATAFITSAGVGQANITGTTDMSAGVLRNPGMTWQLNDVKLYVGGSQEGATDTVAVMPVASTGLWIGDSFATGVEFSGIIVGCKVWTTADQTSF